MWSAEGEGSTFTLRLPRLAAPAQPRPPDRVEPAGRRTRSGVRQEVVA